MKEKTVLILMVAGILFLGNAFLERAEQPSVSAMGAGKDLPDQAYVDMLCDEIYSRLFEN